MSFLKRLFGLGDKPAEETPAGEQREYKGFIIIAEPMRDGAQWRLAGRIVEGEASEAKVHRFIRADVFADRADAVRFAFMKGERLVDELGKNLFL
jgi:hypothetical protein